MSETSKKRGAKKGALTLSEESFADGIINAQLDIFESPKKNETKQEEAKQHDLEMTVLPEQDTFRAILDSARQNLMLEQFKVKLAAAVKEEPVENHSFLKKVYDFIFVWGGVFSIVKLHHGGTYSNLGVMYYSPFLNTCLSMVIVTFLLAFSANDFS